jgi:murein DD-endopeptidase MepM/ murein hydrolase activator NlpD
MGILVVYLSNEEFEYQHSNLAQKGEVTSATDNHSAPEPSAVDISGLESQIADLTSQFRTMAATLEQVASTSKVAVREQKRTRKDLAMIAIQAQFTDLGITALLCALCVGTVGAVKVGVELRASIQENAPPWLVAMIYPGLGITAQSSGDYASPIVGKSLQDLVNYQPTHGQSFGPETGNMRSYGPHGGVDFDCRVGGCAGADIASPIAGTVISIRQIGTSANGGSFQVDIDGEDWGGPVTHQLVHVDSISVKLGDKVKPGQVVAKVSPTDTVSSGPHFDWKIRRNGQWENPQKWAATAMTQTKTSGSENDFVSRYMERVASQESGGSYTAVNPHSGALGKYQFMPTTLASTAESCDGVGRVPSASEFLGNPELQDKIMGCYVARALPTIQRKTSDPYTQCRMTAAYHYSGDSDLYDNAKPQSYAGAAYPSIAEYTKSVCKGF